MKLTTSRCLLAASAAALALGTAGVQSWAEATSQADAPHSFQLVQGQPAPAEAEAESAEEQEIPDITEEMLGDPEVIAAGEAVWQEQCRHCHGRSAYPGKAPKLRPSRYEPEFVYHRVTYGFRGMPAWEDVYSEEERVAVTAYILSPQFSP